MDYLASFKSNLDLDSKKIESLSNLIKEILLVSEGIHVGKEVKISRVITSEDDWPSTSTIHSLVLSDETTVRCIRRMLQTKLEETQHELRSLIDKYRIDNSQLHYLLRLSIMVNI